MRPARLEIFKSVIGRKLVIYMVLFSSLISLMSTAVQLLWDYNNDVDLIEDQLQQVKDIHLESLTISMWVSDEHQLKIHLDGILLLRDMQFIELRDESEVWITNGVRKAKNIMSRTYPLVYSQNKKNINIGSLYLQASLTKVYQRLLDKVWVIFASNGIKIFLVAGFMLVLFYMLSTRHLIKISEFIRTLNVENSNNLLLLDRKGNKKDEIDLVVNAFNEMQHNIKQSFSALRQTEKVWRSLAASTSTLEFDLFMNDVLIQLADIYNCRYALIGRLLADGKSAQTLSVLANGKQIKNFEYSLKDTPCQELLDKNRDVVSAYAEKIYSDEDILIDMGVESYFCAPLIASDGSILGVLSVMDSREMKIDEWSEPVLGVFAKRVALEMEREQTSQKLQQYQGQLEEQVQIRTIDLVAARNEAERANEAKSEFLSHMSHELRTPLNAILGFGQMLELDSSKLSSVQKSNVQEILDAGQHLLNLINEVLNLAQIESGKLEIKMEEIDLSEPLQECIKLMSSSIEDMKIEVIDNVSEHHYFVKADYLRLKQILLNLISNAVKYNKKSGRLILDSRLLDKQRIHICVTDTGEGLSEDETSRLFHPFERLNVKENIEGTGIGLTITKHLIELMGGSIGVKSTLGVGTIFWVELELINKI